MQSALEANPQIITGFNAKVKQLIREKRSLLVVGIDPRRDQLQRDYPDDPLGVALRSFCMKLVDDTYSHAVGFKPNSAFFEQFGIDGMATLIEVIAHCHKVGVPVILDAKRGDIGSTAEAYAAAAYDVYGADAVTVSPFMGSDSIRPFLRQGKGVFVLCKTSNPGSNEVMCLDTVHGPVYRCVGAMVEGLRSLHPDMGLVVGATDPQTVGEVHRAHPDVLILAPGVGAQGGSLAACMASCPDNLLLPMSRALTTSPEAARKAVELMREQWA